MALLQQAAQNSNTSVVMVTHNPTFEQYGDQVIRLKDGVIYRIDDNQSPVKLEDLA